MHLYIKCQIQKAFFSRILFYLVLSMLQKTLTLRRTLICISLRRNMKVSLIHPMSHWNSEAHVIHIWFTLRRSSFPSLFFPTICHYVQILLFPWWIVCFPKNRDSLSKLAVVLIPLHTYANGNLNSSEHNVVFKKKKTGGVNVVLTRIK